LNRRGSGGGGRMRKPKKRVCSFCIDKVESIDYKDVNNCADIFLKEER